MTMFESQSHMEKSFKFQYLPGQSTLHPDQLDPPLHSMQRIMTVLIFERRSSLEQTVRATILLAMI